MGRAERDAKIYTRRSDGFSLRAIAREFKLAVETVRGIAKRMERKAKCRESAVGLGRVNFRKSPVPQDKMRVTLGCDAP